MTTLSSSGSSLVDSRPQRVRVYRCKTPLGHFLRFTSVSAFDGYISARRAMGYVVTFLDPFRAIIAPLAVTK